MASPKSWDLIAAMKVCLQAVSKAEGFHTDAGLFVVDEPTQIPEDQQALLAVVMEAIKRPEEAAVRQTHDLVELAVMAKIGTGANDAQQRLHELIADVQKALADRRDVFPVGIQYPRFLEARVIPPAEGMKWIGAEVRFATHVPKR